MRRKNCTTMIAKFLAALALAYKGLTPEERKTLMKALTSFVVAVATAMGLGTYLLIIGLHEAGAPPPGTGDVEHVVPATGVQGFNVEGFCKDDATTAKQLIVPDGTGTYWELSRLKDGVTETVQVHFLSTGEVDQTYSRHFINSAVGQTPEPAYLTDAAISCVKGKAK